MNEIAFGDHASVDTPARDVILDERPVRSKRVSNARQRNRPRIAQTPETAVAGRKLPQRIEKLGLSLPGGLRELFHALEAESLTAQLLVLDTAVVPIELFSELLDRARKLALSRGMWPAADRAEDEIDQRSSFRLLYPLTGQK